MTVTLLFAWIALFTLLAWLVTGIAWRTYRVRPEGRHVKLRLPWDLAVVQETMSSDTG